MGSSLMAYLPWLDVDAHLFIWTSAKRTGLS
jgi:hypothetical protein